MGNVKTINGLARANVKTRNGLASANIKTINGVDAEDASIPFGGLVDTTNLVESWPLSEASGTRVGVHAGLNLTDNNTVTGGAGVGSSLASYFNGDNSEYLSRTSEAALQTGDIDFTFIGWFYINDGNANYLLIGKDHSTAGQREYQLQWLAATGRLNFSCFRATDVGAAVNTANGAAPVTTWLMFAAWHNAAADTVNVEINANGTIASAATGGALQAASGAQFRLGARSYPSFEGYLRGRMQRVNFFKRVLSAGDRTAFYNSGNGLDY